MAEDRKVVTARVLIGTAIQGLDPELQFRFVALLWFFPNDVREAILRHTRKHEGDLSGFQLKAILEAVIVELDHKFAPGMPGAPGAN